MNKEPFFSIVLTGHHPFVCPSKKEEFSEEEQDFFESLSETWLPLLEMFERLENERIPFRFGMVLSPFLCGMFQDNQLMERYLVWLEKRIDFGKKELKRCAANKEIKALAEQYYIQDCSRKTALTEQYGMDLTGAFRNLQKQDKLELLLTASTNAYLPFYTSVGESICAQIETAAIHHRKYFDRNPAGFWLPKLGWTAELGAYLCEYGFTYTITDTLALVTGNPPAESGFFYPVKTSSGLTVFGRNNAAQRDLENLINSQSGVYRSFHDAGFELSTRALKQLLGNGKSRYSTGYRYWTNTNDIQRRNTDKLYNPQAAAESAARAAKTFIDLQFSRLESAGQYLENPISICAFNTDTLLRNWHEGSVFLETLTKEINSSKPVPQAAENGLRLSTPSDFLAEVRSSSFQTTEPGYSSSLQNGYAERLLDASNDWIYRHIFRSIQRMVELTERFSGDTGLKERALNQAAREILFAQCVDWSEALNPQYQGRINRDIAKQELEGALRNFTTIYESLGASHISTEWLTALERRHYFLPYINHRVFSRKK